MKIKKFLYSSTHALMFHPDNEDEMRRPSIQTRNTEQGHHVPKKGSFTAEI